MQTRKSSACIHHGERCTGLSLLSAVPIHTRTCYLIYSSSWSTSYYRSLSLSLSLSRGLDHMSLSTALAGAERPLCAPRPLHLTSLVAIPMSASDAHAPLSAPWRARMCPSLETAPSTCIICASSAAAPDILTCASHTRQAFAVPSGDPHASSSCVTRGHRSPPGAASSAARLESQPPSPLSPSPSNGRRHLPRKSNVGALVAQQSGTTHVSMILLVTTYGSMLEAGRRSSK